MRSRLRHWTWTLGAAVAALLCAAGANAAGPAPFDLAGPSLQVNVTRGDTTLAIAEVPHLAVGDKLAIKSNFPETQSEHYLMVVTFLRGSTNPPPKDWFYQCATWKRDCAKKGLNVTIPKGAQQVLIFLAPETGGDFKTMVNAVRGRPGAFVRATQDLNQATLDRSRLERYLTAIRMFNAGDPVALKTATPLLARSLGIKVDEKCLDKIPQLQAPCLMQGQESLILNDGHSMSIVEALTSGPASDLAMAASFTPEAAYGYYSPYISTVLDLGRLFDSFRTANFQYIPALATAVGDKLSLTLNTPPSFHEPKSVLVAALPAIESAQPPPLHAVNPKDIYCARRDSLVLPVEGAPLVFSTEYAHDTVLRITGKNGETIDLPASADAVRGGFIVDTSALAAAGLADRIQGSLHGFWGFEKFDGPRFQLVNAHAQPWSRAPTDDGALIVGRENTLHLQASSVACIDRIMIKDPAGKELQVDWSAVKTNEVEINLPLQQVQPGEMTLFVTQFGSKDPQPVELRAFPEAGRLESFTIHAGEAQGVLKGSRLDEVASLSLKGYDFVPVPAASNVEGGTLMMVLKPAASAAEAGAQAGNGASVPGASAQSGTGTPTPGASTQSGTGTPTPGASVPLTAGSGATPSPASAANPQRLPAAPGSASGINSASGAASSAANTASAATAVNAAVASLPATTLKQGESAKAKVTLRDGRVSMVNVSVTAPRPSVELLGKSVQLPARGDASNIELASQNQLPQDAQLTFSVRAKLPATFGRDAALEVATDDEAFATTLNLTNRGLTLADAHVAVATIDPAKAFGASAFGRLKFRVVASGVSGDWQPLATLVRLPALQTLQCPATTDKACKLTGSNLFLVDSFSADPQFKDAVPVPEGFPGRALPVPHPGKSGLYLKLRDDPSVINSATLTAEELPAPPPPPTEEPAAPSTPPAAAEPAVETSQLHAAE
jgi:hypothetical protein